MDRNLVIAITAVVVLILIVVLVYKKEKFTSAPTPSASATPKIHSLIMSQAPEDVQSSQVFITDAIYIFGNNVGVDNQTVTLALALISCLQQLYGLVAGDYFTGNYTGLWSCNSDGVTATWVFNQVPNVVATTFPVQNTVSVPLPSDLTNTYWTCRPDHSTGVPTLAQFNLSTYSMSLWDGNQWN